MCSSSFGRHFSDFVCQSVPNQGHWRTVLQTLCSKVGKVETMVSVMPNGIWQEEAMEVLKGRNANVAPPPLKRPEEFSVKFVSDSSGEVYRTNDKGYSAHRSAASDLRYLSGLHLKYQTWCGGTPRDLGNYCREDKEAGYHDITFVVCMLNGVLVKNKRTKVLEYQGEPTHFENNIRHLSRVLPTATAPWCN